MRITIGTFALTGLAPTEGVDEFSIDGEGDVQIIKPIRAASARPLDRGNEIYSISFKIERTHNNAGVAAAFMLRHLRELPRSGTLMIVCTKASGAVIQQINFASAVIKGRGGKFTGASTSHRYNIIAGGMS